MELRPSWEANGISAGQEVTRILWKPKVHYLSYNIPSLTTSRHLQHPVTYNIPSLTLTQLNAIHALPTFNFNIVLPSTSRSSTWSLSCMYLSTLSHRPRGRLFLSPSTHTQQRNLKFDSLFIHFSSQFTCHCYINCANSKRFINFKFLVTFPLYIWV